MLNNEELEYLSKLVIRDKRELGDTQIIGSKIIIKEKLIRKLILFRD